MNKGAVMPSSNLQCEFSDNQRSETVRVQMISSNSWDQGDSEARVEVSLTLGHTDADLELDRIQLVCKGRSIFRRQPPTLFYVFRQIKPSKS